VHGKLYVTELNDCVRMVDVMSGYVRHIPDGLLTRVRHVSTVAGTCVSGYMDGRADESMFNFPYGICFDASNSYVHSCHLINIADTVVTVCCMYAMVTIIAFELWHLLIWILLYLRVWKLISHQKLSRYLICCDVISLTMTVIPLIITLIAS